MKLKGSLDALRARLPDGGAIPWRDSWLAGRYLALGQRDRRALHIGLAVAVAAILYTGVHQPIAEYRAAGVEDFLRQQSRLQWMQAHEARARRTGSEAAPKSSDQSLLMLVDNTAQAFDLSLTRYQPDSAGGVTVVIEQQPFNAILRWTDRLRAQHGLHMAQASIHAEADTGLVNARFRVR